MPKGMKGFQKGHKICVGRIISQETREKIGKAGLGKFIGSLSPLWKGGKPKCIYCKLPVKNYNNKMHRSCMTKFHIKENHPLYKHGNKTKCIDCGKIIWIQFSRCRRCASKGKLNRNWKGGISPIKELIHSLKEYKEWKLAILKKYNFTCQDCGKRGGRNLDAHHHPKSYSELVKEFLKQYNQFSPIEDKETLLRLAITHNPFWDINGAIILCRTCHKKTDNYFYKGATYEFSQL